MNVLLLYCNTGIALIRAKMLERMQNPPYFRIYYHDSKYFLKFLTILKKKMHRTFAVKLFFLPILNIFHNIIKWLFLRVRGLHFVD